MAETDDLDDADLEDLLPDELTESGEGSKGRAVPLKRTRKQIQTQTEKDEKAAATLRDQQAAQQLAQIINLHIAGISLADIGSQIGMTGDEVDAMLQRDAQRYVRSQPALRVYVRNYVSSKYSELLEAVWDEATDKDHAEKLENLREARGILDKMARLHGAEAPVQSEVKVEAAPESIDRMVSLLAAQAGRAYDMSVFDDDDDDIVDADIVDEIDAGDLVEASGRELEVSRNAVGEEGEDDGL